MKVYFKLGGLLKSLRNENRLSQSQVSKIINCSRGAYSSWEQDNGEIPLSRLMLLLNHYNVSPMDFLQRIYEENEIKLLTNSNQNISDPLGIIEELTHISNRLTILNQTLFLRTTK